MSELLRRIDETEARARALEERLADPALAGRSAEYADLARQLGRMRPLLDAGSRYRRLAAELADARALGAEAEDELHELARVEAARLEPELEKAEREVRLLLAPRDANDERNVILEIRSGAGGEEASLFAHDLYRMYVRYAERRGWKIEPLSISQSSSGGIKEVIASIAG